jgi:hypothetical protein
MKVPRITRAVAFVAVVLCTAVLLADRQHVVADDKVDFAVLKSFSIREGRATTTRPELNNKLILQNIGNAIRRQLSAKGLTETPDRSDVVVGFTIGQDRPNGPSVTFDQGTLVIDITTRAGNALIWHGVYTDDKSPPAKVAEKLPRGVEKLLGEYPPKKKKK